MARSHYEPARFRAGFACRLANLTPRTSGLHVAEIFSHFGTVVACDTFRSLRDSRLNDGFVEFEFPGQALRAHRQMHLAHIDGRAVRVEIELAAICDAYKKSTARASRPSRKRKNRGQKARNASGNAARDAKDNANVELTMPSILKRTNIEIDSFKSRRRRRRRKR